MDGKIALIALNGHFRANKDQYRQLIQTRDNSVIIAADGGALLLKQLGILPDILIGDFDSITSKQLDYFKENNVDIYQYPVVKDKTDAELALDYCLDNNFDRVEIFGTTGGRIDQQLANIFLLEYALREDLKAIIREPGLEIGLINHKIILKEKSGFTLSLIPISDIVSGINITGCKYKLEDEKLYRYKTRGISNVILNNKVVIEIKKGLLLYLINKNNEHHKF